MLGLGSEVPEYQVLGLTTNLPPASAFHPEQPEPLRATGDAADSGSLPVVAGLSGGRVEGSPLLANAPLLQRLAADDPGPAFRSRPPAGLPPICFPSLSPRGHYSSSGIVCWPRPTPGRIPFQNERRTTVRFPNRFSRGFEPSSRKHSEIENPFTPIDFVAIMRSVGARPNNARLLRGRRLEKFVVSLPFERIRFDRHLTAFLPTPKCGSRRGSPQFFIRFPDTHPSHHPRQIQCFLVRNYPISKSRNP